MFISQHSNEVDYSSMGEGDTVRQMEYRPELEGLLSALTNLRNNLRTLAYVKGFYILAC